MAFEWAFYMKVFLLGRLVIQLFKIFKFPAKKLNLKLQGWLEKKLKEIVKYQASPFKVSNLVIVEFLYFSYEIL